MRARTRRPSHAGWCVLVAALIVSCSAPRLARAQLQRATLQGTVTGPDGVAIPHAAVTLIDRLGTPVAATASAGDGTYRLDDIAPGVYALRADPPGLSARIARIDVAGALPARVDLRMAAVAAEQVTVRSDAERLTRASSRDSAATSVSTSRTGAGARTSATGARCGSAWRPGCAELSGARERRRAPGPDVAAAHTRGLR